MKKTEQRKKTAKCWSENQTEEFIELLKQNSCLINTTITDYKDKNKKQMAIEDMTLS